MSKDKKYQLKTAYFNGEIRDHTWVGVENEDYMTDDDVEPIGVEIYSCNKGAYLDVEGEETIYLGPSKNVLAELTQILTEPEPPAPANPQPVSFEIKTKGAKALGELIYHSLNSLTGLGRDNYVEQCDEAGERVWEFLFGHFPADKMPAVEALRVQVKHDEDKISSLTDKIRNLERKLLESDQLEQRLRNANDQLKKYASNQESRESKNKTLLTAVGELLNNAQSVLANIQPKPKED